MSKRKNYQAMRRRVRRVLNAAGDAWVGRISRVIYRVNYGGGLINGHIGKDQS